MDINTMLNLQGTILFIIIIGYVITKMGIMPVSIRQNITNLVINVILPCNVIVSFLIEFNSEILVRCLQILLVSLANQVVISVIGRYFYPHADEDSLPALRYATLVSNAGFLGSPIVEGLYGSMGLLYASIFLIPQRIMMWTSGMAYFSGEGDRNALKKSMTHPCIVAVFIGLFLMITQLQLPGVVLQTLKSLSNCNLAMSMLVIGNILADCNVKELFNKTVLWFCTVRLVLIPTVMLVVLRLLGLHELVIGVATVLAGMPAAATTAILAAKYDRGSRLAVSLVVLSTALSVVTIPIFCLIMLYF